MPGWQCFANQTVWRREPTKASAARHIDLSDLCQICIRSISDRCQIYTRSDQCQSDVPWAGCARESDTWADAVGTQVLSVPLTTLPDSTPPQPAATFSSISQEAVAFSVTQDEPGVMYLLLVVPGSQANWQEALAPGASLLGSAVESQDDVLQLLHRKPGVALSWAMHLGI